MHPRTLFLPHDAFTFTLSKILVIERFSVHIFNIFDKMVNNQTKLILNPFEVIGYSQNTTKFITWFFISFSKLVAEKNKFERFCKSVEGLYSRQVHVTFSKQFWSIFGDKTITILKLMTGTIIKFYVKRSRNKTSKTKKGFPWLTLQLTRRVTFNKRWWCRTWISSSLYKRKE